MTLPYGYYLCCSRGLTAAFRRSNQRYDRNRKFPRLFSNQEPPLRFQAVIPCTISHPSQMNLNLPVIIALITGLLAFNCIIGVIWFATKRKHSRVQRKRLVADGICGKHAATFKSPYSYGASTSSNSKPLSSQSYIHMALDIRTRRELSGTDTFKSIVLLQPIPSLILNGLSETTSGPPGLAPRPSLLMGLADDTIQRRSSARSVDSASIYSAASAPLELHEGSAPESIPICPDLSTMTWKTPVPSIASYTCWPRQTLLSRKLVPETFANIHWKAEDTHMGNTYDPVILFERARHCVSDKPRKQRTPLLSWNTRSLMPPSLAAKQADFGPSAGRQIVPSSPPSSLPYLPSPYSPPLESRLLSRPTLSSHPC